eukprot:12823359-Alexandrium_andersonii.AAC.1
MHWSGEGVSGGSGGGGWSSQAEMGWGQSGSACLQSPPPVCPWALNEFGGMTHYPWAGWGVDASMWPVPWELQMQQVAWLGGYGWDSGKGSKGVKGSSGTASPEAWPAHANVCWKGEAAGKGVKGQSGQSSARQHGNMEAGSGEITQGGSGSADGGKGG